MNWSSDPPRIAGWWFVGEPSKRRVEIVTVRQHRKRWQWSFVVGGLTWNSVDDYPKYKWAGPIVEPSLENFNRVK